jgi:hypothetical protein
MDKRTNDLDLIAYHDKAEDLVKSKIKGGAVDLGEKSPKKPVARVMEALRETAESLKRY